MRKRGNCFYCGRGLRAPRKHAHWPDEYSIDHVIPRSAIVRSGAILTARQHAENRVECCKGCNSRKGDAHPVTWLETLRPEYAARLTELLSRLPVDVVYGRC